jgi:hypothetical protein
MHGASPFRSVTQTRPTFRLAWPAKVLIGLTALHLLSRTAIELLDSAGEANVVLAARWGWLAAATIAPILVAWTVFRSTRGSLWACNAAYCALFGFVVLLGRLSEPDVPGKVDSLPPFMAYQARSTLVDAGSPHTPTDAPSRPTDLSGNHDLRPAAVASSQPHTPHRAAANWRKALDEE